MPRQRTSPATTTETTVADKVVLPEAVSATDNLSGQDMSRKGPKPQNRHSWPTPPALQPRHPNASMPHWVHRSSRKHGSLPDPVQVEAASLDCTAMRVLWVGVAKERRM